MWDRETVLGISRGTGVFPSSNPWDLLTKIRSRDDVFSPKFVMQYGSVVVSYLSTFNECSVSVFDQEPFPERFVHFVNF